MTHDQTKKQTGRRQVPLAVGIAQRLFTNGINQVADRLVLADTNGTDIGTWRFWAVRDEIQKIILEWLKARQ